MTRIEYACPASLKDMTMADPAINACPYDYYAKMRAEAPVHYDARMGLWLVTRHADIVEASHHWEVFSSHIDMRRDVSTVDPTEADALFLREAPELEEMLGVAVYMGGGPALMYAAETLAAWDDLMPKP